ncbi:MAG: NAD+ synthase [Actinomycetia bacterium]|nr:NAD+ synthase [Actinomycetes bacterium]
MRVALCQINTAVGALEANAAAILEAYARAEAAGADVALFPELAITGYPPEDLLLKPGFVADAATQLRELASSVTGRCAAVVGWVEGTRHPGADPHDALDGPWNAAAVLHGGRIVGSYRKQALPNYGVFDERRYFDPGPPSQALYSVRGIVVAVTVCEDVWVQGGPAVAAADHGARLVLNINASPFRADKQELRFATLGARVAESGVPVAYVNQVGGQDELVFDGGSMVVGTDGLVCRAARFSEDFVLADVPVAPPRRVAGTVIELGGEPAGVEVPGVVSSGAAGAVAYSPMGPEELWSALCLGTRDYVHKNGFTDVVVGLSGGVDSALVAAIAADAVGARRTHVVLMPSRHSSDHSVLDAEALAANLGVQSRTIAIEPAHAAFTEMLSDSFAGLEEGLAEENLQSRIRGVLLMALSNKFGWLVLTTGNKSETAVGYSTLYGDSAGGLAVIKDLPKLSVYELCRWRNSTEAGEWIPESILDKAPSAELRPDQTDDQSLPPYEVLDPLIEDYVDADMTAEQLVAAGHDPDLVSRIARLVDLAEYKRRQSPPGLRVSEKAFGRDRRLPITNAYRPRG